MVTKIDLMRLRLMMKAFESDVCGMEFNKKCLWSDMLQYVDAMIEEEFENEECS